MIYLLLFIIGICVGSFLNVIIYRETKEVVNEKVKTKNWKQWMPDWAKGRSFCDHCKKQLAWYDNIPLLSYLMLKGRCRYCRKKIPIQYPIVELLTGIEFVWIYFLISKNLDFLSRFEGFYSFLTLIFWLGMGACLLAVFTADIKAQIIPDTAVFGGILLALFKIWIDYRYTGMIDWSLFASALGAGLFFTAIVLITKGKGMGIGDVKLAFLMGLVLGFPKIVWALSFSFLTGALVGVILMVVGNKTMKSKIAFGPFLVAGMVFAIII